MERVMGGTGRVITNLQTYQDRREIAYEDNTNLQDRSFLLANLKQNIRRCIDKRHNLNEKNNRSLEFSY